MKKQMVMFLLCILLVFTFSACGGCGSDSNSAKETDNSATSAEKETDSDVNDPTETPKATTEPENSSSGEQEKTSDQGSDSAEGQTETSEPDTGNFEGLDVQDETTIELEDGEAVVIQ